jgi:hypothetical protein
MITVIVFWHPKAISLFFSVERKGERESFDTEKTKNKNKNKKES